jgi:hypothetical protein
LFTVALVVVALVVVVEVAVEVVDEVVDVVDVVVGNGVRVGVMTIPVVVKLFMGIVVLTPSSITCLFMCSEEKRNLITNSCSYGTCWGWR